MRARLLGLCLAASGALGVGVACSRTPEEPNPIVRDPSKSVVPPGPPGPVVALKTEPGIPPPAAHCPVDPAPGEIATLYGKGKASFQTPDGATHTFEVEIARTEQAQARGLMYRTSLAEGAGMVFAFAESHHARFWMKNTCIPLDIVFVGEDNRVLGVVTARPLDESGVEVSGFSKWVVELAAGVAKKRGIGMGTTFVPPP
jgi:hypothetical protein